MFSLRLELGFDAFMTGDIALTFDSLTARIGFGQLICNLLSALGDNLGFAPKLIAKVLVFAHPHSVARCR